jgi:hypothetical protein
MRPGPILRSWGLSLLAAGVVLAVPPWPLGEGALLPVEAAHPELALSRICTLLASLLACWVLLAAGLSVAASLPGHLGRVAARVSRRVTPALLRQWLAGMIGSVGGLGMVTMVGVTVASTPMTAVAFAAPASQLAVAGVAAGTDQPPPPIQSATPGVPGGSAAGYAQLPAPEQPAARAHVARASTQAHGAVPSPHRSTPVTPAPTVPTVPTVLRPATPAPPGPTVGGSGASHADRRPGPRSASVTVVAGDTLWSLAGEALGPGAGAAEVAQSWPQWWQTNRQVIGADPDLIHPGQRLTVPQPAAAPAAPAGTTAPQPATPGDRP